MSDATTTSTGTPAPYQIHHYPASLIDMRVLASGQRLTLRPVLPQDSLLVGELVAALSPQARQQRFHGAWNLSAQRLVQMCCVDYTRHLALVVTAEVDGTERVIADARYSVQADQLAAEFALVVDERWQGLGLGTWLMQTLQLAAASAGLQWLRGEVLSGNAPMLALMERLGFHCTADPADERVITVRSRLAARAGRPIDKPGVRPSGPAAAVVTAPLRRRLARLSALWRHLVDLGPLRRERSPAQTPRPTDGRAGGLALQGPLT